MSRKQWVYIDTSVIGGCFDEEFLIWSNALMDDFRQGRLFPVVSELVTAEIMELGHRTLQIYSSREVTFYGRES